MVEYPDEWESDAVLADGITVHVRPIRPTDGPALREAMGKLSPESLYFRFFSPKRELRDSEVEYLVNVDYEDRMALVVEQAGEGIAVGRYDRLADRPTAAEVAFTVIDDHRGRGIGTLLLEHLGSIAREKGITCFTATVLPDNRRMLRVFRHAGYHASSHFESGVIEIEIPLEVTDDVLASIEDRERQAGSRSIQNFLAPRSVAVVGAGRQPGNTGREYFRNLVVGEFNGPVYPVNPNVSDVASVSTVDSVLDIPGPLDLAIVAVPAPAVPEIVEECGRKGVAGLVVVTAGFAEVDDAGAAAERALVARCRHYGMRLVGPNCLGLVNTSLDVHMNGSLAPGLPRPGRVAFVSQAGLIGVGIMSQAAGRRVGLSSFLALGNKADVSANDLLEFWEQDAGTDVVMLYVESFGNPRRFSRIARRVSRTKPIVAVASTRDRLLTPEQTSRTAAMTGVQDAVEALFRQTGVIRVGDVGEMLDVASLLSEMPLPRGRRMAVVGNVHAPVQLAAEACEAAGLELASLTDATKAAVEDLGLGIRTVRNPMALGFQATAEDSERVLRLVLGDANVDGVVFSHLPQFADGESDIAAATAAAADSVPDKPIVANFYNPVAVVDSLLMPQRPTDRVQRRVPVYGYPEQAARALAHATRYAAWLARDPGVPPQFDDLDRDGAQEIVADVLAGHPDGRWLEIDEAAALLAAYGVHIARTARAADADGAVEAAKDLGFPVAVKAVVDDPEHRDDEETLHLDVANAGEVRAVVDGLGEHFGDGLRAVLVQDMVLAGVNTIVGLVTDPDFGPIVMFGMGGRTVELLADLAFRVLPVTDRDVRELIGGVRGAPLLTGWKGSPPMDVDALEEFLLRVGALAEDVPEIVEMDLNPVMVSTAGAVAVDARVHLAPAAPRPDLAIRRLW